MRGDIRGKNLNISVHKVAFSFLETTTMNHKALPFSFHFLLQERRDKEIRENTVQKGNLFTGTY